jgi:single-strand DNA-binding protein
MVNVWCFSGRVGQPPELRTTQSGEKVLGFSIANDVGFGNNKKTQWVECSYWGKRAESVHPYINKGDRLTVSGELQLVEFQRKDGTPGSKLAVRVNDLDLAARSDSASAGGGGGQDYGAETSSAKRGGGKPSFDADLGDEIPFIFS